MSMTPEEKAAMLDWLEVRGVYGGADGEEWTRRLEWIFYETASKAKPTFESLWLKAKKHERDEHEKHFNALLAAYSGE